MAFRLVNSGGNVTDPAIVNMRCSGVIHAGEVVDFSRTGGTGVTPASFASTTTSIFGVAMSYTQGTGDSYSVRVIPFAPGQLWEADCVNAAATAQVGIRMSLSPGAGAAGDDRGKNLYNTISDATTATAIFRCVALASALGTGSGKILGYFRRGDDAGTPTVQSAQEIIAY